MVAEEEDVQEEEEVWDGKESSCPVSEERREQERRSAICREVQRRSNDTHCSVTLQQPETDKHCEGTAVLLQYYYSNTARNCSSTAVQQ